MKLYFFVEYVIKAAIIEKNLFYIILYTLLWHW